MNIITRLEAKKQGLKRFFTGVPCLHGHLCERSVAGGACLECDNMRTKKRYDPTYAKQYNKQYNEENSDKVKVTNDQRRAKYPNESKENARRYRQENPDKVRERAESASGRLSAQLATLKRRAKARGLEFDLVRDEIIIPDVCPVLGIPLELVNNRTRSKKQDATPTFDRVDNNKGYTKDNVRIISWRANRLKSDGMLEEFKAIVSYMEQHNDPQQK